jgi:MFS family permease
MLVNILDVSLYIFGESMVSMVVVLPAFMLELGASNQLVALLPALYVLGARLPPVATSYFVETWPRLKPLCLATGVPMRLPWLVLGLVTLWLARGHPGVVLLVLMVCFAVSHTSFGLSSPAYGELIAKTIPPQRRGMFMGWVTLVGNALGVVGGLYVKWVMDRSGLAFPANYATLFLTASALLWISYVFFALNREPLLTPGRHHENWGAYLRSLPVVLRQDRNFCWYLVYQSLIYGYAMGSGLFMAYALKHFRLDDTVTGKFLVASTVATMVAAPVMGWLGDRYGHKLNLVIACLAHVGAAVIATLATDWRMMYAVFALTAVCIAGQWISARNYIYLFGVNGRRPTYLALANTVPAPFILAFAFVGGWLAEHLAGGYAAAFLISAGICAAAAWVLIARVRTPALAPRPVPLVAAGLEEMAG